MAYRAAKHFSEEHIRDPPSIWTAGNGSEMETFLNEGPVNRDVSWEMFHTFWRLALEANYSNTILIYSMAVAQLFSL